MYYLNRHDAALRLIPLLEKYVDQDCVILSVPRGGVPIGFYIAKNYDVPMELLLTKKIGHPLNREVAIGAVGLEDQIVDEYTNVSQDYIDNEIVKIKASLKKRLDKFMGHKKPIALENKTVIIVDDGIATGNTLFLAIKMIRKKKPRKIVVAVPVSPYDTAERIKAMTDDFICPLVVHDFRGVGGYYSDFSQVSDEEVVEYINQLD